MLTKSSCTAWRLALAALAAFSWTGGSAQAEESPVSLTSDTALSVITLSEPVVVQTLKFITLEPQSFNPVISVGNWTEGVLRATPIEIGGMTYAGRGNLTLRSANSIIEEGCVMSSGVLPLTFNAWTTPGAWLTLPTTKSQSIAIYESNDLDKQWVKGRFTIADSSWSDSDTAPKFLAERTSENALASLQSRLDGDDSILTAWDLSLDTPVYFGVISIGQTVPYSRPSNVTSASMSIRVDAALPAGPLTLWHRPDMNSDWVSLPSEVTRDGQYLNFSANNGLFGSYAITEAGASIPEPTSLGLLALAFGGAAMRRRPIA